MARKVPKTKAGKLRKIHTVLSEFKRGKLKSGSKKGPKIKSRRQAIAVALKMAGMSKKRKKKKR